MNLVAPRSVLDRTATGVLDALTATTSEVNTADVNTAINANEGDPRYKAKAVKALRNLGYPIIAHKQRQLSWYKLAGTPSEYETHRTAMMRSHYSRQVTACREFAGAANAAPNDLSLATVLRLSQMTAIALGTDVAIGKSIAEVMAEVQILSP